MAETLDQIGAAIPNVRLGWIGSEHAGPEIDEIPGGRCRAPNVEWELQLVRSNLVAHRVERAEIGPDRGCVLARDLRRDTAIAGYRRTPFLPMPSCRVRQKSSSDQLPIPVATSGVMFGPSSVPNGVSSAAPPANGLPPGAVWQPMQSPATARYRPRSICSNAWPSSADRAVIAPVIQATSARVTRQRTLIPIPRRLLAVRPARAGRDSSGTGLRSRRRPNRRARLQYPSDCNRRSAGRP